MKKLDIIILCGGLGKRIKSKSKDLPKILIEIKKKVPFIKFLLHSLKSKYLKNIILSAGYRKNKLKSYIIKNPELNLKFSTEKKPLGTGGALRNTLKNHYVTNPFFVVNGDTFFYFNIEKFFNKNILNSKKSYILLKKNEKVKRFDQFKVINNKLIMINKKVKGKNLINSGLYLFYKKDLRIRKKIFSIEEDIIPKLIKQKRLNYIINNSNTFFDIGVPKDLNKFRLFVKKKNYRFL